METRSEQLALRAYKLSELATLYGISRKTMRSWLKKISSYIGKRHGHYYTIPQVKTIFLKLGEPGKDDM